MLSYRFAGLTDLGMVRHNNEDRWFADPACGLFLVADGMGGHRAGEVAAQIVVDSLPCQLKGLAEDHNDINQQVADEVCCAIQELNEIVVSASAGDVELEGLGATLVLCLVRNDQALVAHLGDSRAYLLRNGELIRLTKDHTIVQSLLDRGEITQDEVADHPAQGRVRRFVGMTEQAPPDTRIIGLMPGDRLLLCSDGLTDMLSDDQICNWLRLSDDPQAISAAMIQAANDAGGEDNVTALMVQCEAAAVDAHHGSTRVAKTSD